jgi:hypothetical protein
VSHLILFWPCSLSTSAVIFTYRKLDCSF